MRHAASSTPPACARGLLAKFAAAHDEPARARGQLMNLYPAIDMLGGKAVRLVKGDFDASKVYDEDPLSAASELGAGGGAAPARRRPRRSARRRAREPRVTCGASPTSSGVPVQFGGGLRSLTRSRTCSRAGVERVILGTAAFTDPDAARAKRSERWPGQVLVSVDVRGGRVATAGWTETIDGGPEEVDRRARPSGARASCVYTNVDRDGMLEGPDLEEVRTRRRGRARQLRLLRRHRRAGRPRRAGEPGAPASPGDRRQGAVRAALHGCPGPDCARGGVTAGARPATVDGCTTSV